MRWDFSTGRCLCTVSVIDEEQRKQCGQPSNDVGVVGRNLSVVCGKTWLFMVCK